MGGKLRTNAAHVRLQWGRGCVATEIARTVSATFRRRGLQWGRGCVATEIPGRKIAGLMTLSLQWGRGCVATEMCSAPSIKCELTVPSMGPWLCSHGNRPSCRPMTDAEQPSMGPWLCSHGNGASGKPDGAGLCHLQWGRGCVATEIILAQGARYDRGRASMGPWLCSHGNPACAADQCARTKLQWGRGCVATEIVRQT